MKRYLSALLLSAFSWLCYAQGQVASDFLSKYNGREGYSLVHISGKMLSGISGNDTGTKPVIRSVTILTADSTVTPENKNFLGSFKSSKWVKSFEEIMTVSSKDGLVSFFARRESGRITELLMFTGGKDKNSVISITGNFSLNDISEITAKNGLVNNNGELKE
jgi:hypothetical protein